MTELTEEQINNMLAGAASRAIEEYKKQQETQKEPEKTTINQEAEKNYNDEKEKATKAKELEAAIKFNLSIEKFLTDNKDFMPAESVKFMEAVNGKSFSSESLKADELRKSLIELWVKEQKNIDCLPQSHKDKVAEFKSLTDDEKTKQSGKFWDIVEVGVNNRTLMRRAEQINRTAGMGGGSDYQSDYEKRFLENKMKRD